MSGIKCGLCAPGTYHADLAAYKAFHNIGGFTAPPLPQPAQSGVVAQSRLLPGRVGAPGMITERQYFHLKDRLEQDPDIICHWTKNYASTRISALHAEERKRKAPVSTAAPTSKIPLNLLRNLPDGYYAARQSAEEDWNFFRVSRPKKNQYAGCIKVQTQHGDMLKLALVVWPSDNVSLYNPRVENDILLCSVDPRGCGSAYAEVLRHCQKCGKDLTDPRSRWYGIGPDCEKRFPEVIDDVNDRKGVFTHGS